MLHIQGALLIEKKRIACFSVVEKDGNVAYNIIKPDIWGKILE